MSEENELRKQVAERDDMINRLQNDMRELDATINTIVRGHANGQQTVNDLSSQLAEVRRDNEFSEQAEQDCSDLELENQSLSEELDDQRALVSDLYDQIEALEGELEAARKPAKKSKKVKR